MRILLAGSYGTSSGIDVYTATLARALEGDGHAVTVADRSGRPGPAALPPVRGRVRRVAGALEGSRTHAALREIAARERADVVHATHLELAFAGGPPVVATAWDPVPGVLRRARVARTRGDLWREELLYAIVDRRACRRAAAIVAVTPAVHEALGGLRAVAERGHRATGADRTHRAGRSRQRIVMLPGFLLDEETGEPPASRSRGCVMVANGLDAPRKGLALALEAVALARARIPGLTLTLVGDWVDPAARAALPAYCHATGRLDRAATRAAVRGAGCALLPSIWEELGYAGLEALATGTPLVCGPLPAFTGMRANGVRLVPDRDPARWAAAICDAVEGPAAVFPAQCRASAVLPQLVALYESVA